MTSQALASRVHRGKSQEHMVRRRDAAGGEMEMLAKVANDPNPDPKEVRDYIVQLLQKEHIEPQVAGQVLASMPRDPAGLRNWARVMFQAVMHEGIHAEAAFPREHFPSPDQPQQPPPSPIAQATPAAPALPAVPPSPAPPTAGSNGP